MPLTLLFEMPAQELYFLLFERTTRSVISRTIRRQCHTKRNSSHFVRTVKFYCSRELREASSRELFAVSVTLNEIVLAPFEQ